MENKQIIKEIKKDLNYLLKINFEDRNKNKFGNPEEMEASNKLYKLKLQLIREKLNQIIK
jgi:hypothetical protein